MIVRLTLGVVLAGALLAATAPALTAVRADAADAAMERQLGSLADRLRSMAAVDDAVRGGGARRVATLRLPARSPTTAGIEAVRFRRRAGGAVATWRTERGTTGTERLADVPIRPTQAARVLAEPGPHRLVFALRREAEGPLLTVRRPDDRETATAGS
ncbi:DUF7311 family protein [Haloarcula litorea]|uniref:DUF7311 family protein n=1 Tax=Haloarcula litorea TaxID=3032579 RepID=UPI0023E84C69|nr:hypothetical protein [Halomicroarcula sp. GDY20]